jgi:hypothetical protein
MIKHDEAETKVCGERLHEIWWQGRQWAVTEFGIECRDGSYPIEAKRLCEEHRQEHPYSWIAHVGAKTWVDVDDFATAFFVACAMHGKHLTHADRQMLAKHHAKIRRKKAP